MRARIILAAILSLGLVDGALAFEVDGFVSGMPIEDALKLARQRGFAYKDAAKGISFMSYGSTNGGPGLGFTQGKLCSLGHFDAGDVHRFVELVNQRASIFGVPTYTLHQEIMGTGKSFSQIAAKWRSNSDQIHVIIDKIGSAQETISWQYKDTALCPGL
ncbi:MAG: hypothetical protein ACHQAY_28310 [Hyphomicrobiales bacterium]